MPVHAASVHMACAICITLSPRAARLVENKLLCKRERFVQRVRVHHHDLLVTVRALAVHLKRPAQTDSVGSGVLGAAS